jgi:uncharacterized membrane protein
VAHFHLGECHGQPSSAQVVASARVILFLGNIIVTGWWKSMADRTCDPKIIAFAQSQVSATDRVFTLGGILILAAAGAGTAAIGGFSATTRWIEWGDWFFAGSGIVWVVALLPIQTKLSRIAKGFADGRQIPADYWRIGKWAIFGIIATFATARRVRGDGVQARIRKAPLLPAALSNLDRMDGAISPGRASRAAPSCGASLRPSRAWRS